jgi:hypothetical protein
MTRSDYSEHALCESASARSGRGSPSQIMSKRTAYDRLFEYARKTSPSFTPQGVPFEWRPHVRHKLGVRTFSSRTRGEARKMMDRPRALQTEAAERTLRKLREDA